MEIERPQSISIPDIQIQPPSPRSQPKAETISTDENQNCSSSHDAEMAIYNSSKEMQLNCSTSHSTDLNCRVNPCVFADGGKIVGSDDVILPTNCDQNSSSGKMPDTTQNKLAQTSLDILEPQNGHNSLNSTVKTQTTSDIKSNASPVRNRVSNGYADNVSDNELDGVLSHARNLSTKSNSLSAADLKGQERPVVTRRDSKKSVNSATVHDSDIAFAARKEEMMTIRRRSESVLEYKEHAHFRLQEELLLAQQELKLKDDEVKKLTRFREQMSEEIEELTASLFEEANKMVQDAHIRRMKAEKLLKEANSKIDMLQAEVTALKTLVITSTPSAPNPHLNPQITQTQDTTNHKKTEKFVKGHRRSTSHHNISREISLTELKLPRPGLSSTSACGIEGVNICQTQRELDPEFFKLFQQWRLRPTLGHTCPLLKALFREDVMPCMAFANQELAKSVLESVFNNTLTIEPVQEKDMYRKCVLTQCNSICKHRVKLKDGESFVYVSQIARNRVAAVCDLFTYLRYIVQGLVKSNEKDIYWEITRLRKQMCLAKLGYVS